jgi:hypothetical protein
MAPVCNKPEPKSTSSDPRRHAIYTRLLVELEGRTVTYKGDGETVMNILLPAADVALNARGVTSAEIAREESALIDLAENNPRWEVSSSVPKVLYQQMKIQGREGEITPARSAHPGPDRERSCL